MGLCVRGENGEARRRQIWKGRRRWKLNCGVAGRHGSRGGSYVDRIGSNAFINNAVPYE